MQLQEIDKAIYKQKQRKVAVVLCIIFAIIGLSLSALFRQQFGNPEGSNTWVNLSGVLLGAVITIAGFTQVKSRPYFDELRYAWNLKRQALKIQNHRHRWEKQLEEGDQTAATVLAFYHKATLQLQSLEGNDFGHADSLKREEKFIALCNEKQLDSQADKFSVDLLEDLKA